MNCNPSYSIYCIMLAIGTASFQAPYLAPLVKTPIPFGGQNTCRVQKVLPTPATLKPMGYIKFSHTTNVTDNHYWKYTQCEPYPAQNMGEPVQGTGQSRQLTSPSYFRANKINLLYKCGLLSFGRAFNHRMRVETEHRTTPYLRPIKSIQTMASSGTLKHIRVPTFTNHENPLTLQVLDQRQKGQRHIHRNAQRCIPVRSFKISVAFDETNNIR
jgi:hypothetical protein